MGTGGGYGTWGQVNMGQVGALDGTWEQVGARQWGRGLGDVGHRDRSTWINMDIHGLHTH